MKKKRKIRKVEKKIILKKGNFEKKIWKKKQKKIEGKFSKQKKQKKKVRITVVIHSDLGVGEQWSPIPFRYCLINQHMLLCR